MASALVQADPLATPLTSSLKPSITTDTGMVRIGFFMGGVVDDYRRRIPHYWSDLWMAASRKTASSALFMFFATFASTVALGVVVSRNTKCSDASTVDQARCTSGESLLGVSEWLLMNSVAGIVHAVAGCQPLLVLRPTGPITAFVSLLFNVSCSLNLHFFELLAWTGVFVSLYMTVVAGFELSRHIKLLTRFTHDIFAVFVCSIYVVDGIQGVYKRFAEEKQKYPADKDHSVAESLWAFNLSLLLLGIAFVLHGFRKSLLLTERLRQLLTDYALTIATVVCVVVSYLPVWSAAASIEVERVDLRDRAYSSRVSIEPTLPGRAWLADLTASPPEVIVAGMVAAIPIVVFFYFDQNVSSLLCQAQSMHLTKGRYMHSSFLCMALFNLFGPLLGLPFVTGSLPHSPQMVSALTESKQRSSDTGEVSEVVVHENRVAPALMYALIGLCLLLPVGRSAIEAIPNAAVDGILIFIGVAGMMDTQLWSRVGLLLTEERNFGRQYQSIHPSKVRLFTVVQLGALLLAWALNGVSMGVPAMSPLGLCFPFVVVTLVPLRLKLMPWVFSCEELAVLDGDDGVGSSPEHAKTTPDHDDNVDATMSSIITS